MDSQPGRWRQIGGRVATWFDLTQEERRFFLGVLAIALIGLVARFIHLKGEKPENYQPDEIQTAGTGRTP
ncbi:MAG: hypothetical protein V2A34_06575 [Lentisphaerota bacterium]